MRLPRTLSLFAITGLLPLAGCLKHTIQVTSDPAGALVWLNDVEAGRTPLETDFTFYGTYDVRLEREGYEPVITKAEANAPIQELPGIDLVASAIPVMFRDTVRWHYVLKPIAEAREPQAQAEGEFVTRANAMRANLAAPGPGWIPPDANWVPGKSISEPARPVTPGK